MFARLSPAVIVAVLVAFIALAAAACSGGSLDDETPDRGVNQVAVEDSYFEPRVIEISAGTEVTWHWQGQIPHDVKGDGFESSLQRSGTFRHTFETPGTYDYACSLHRGMTGRVIVTD